MEENKKINNKKEELKKQIETLTNENNRLKEENKELINQTEFKNSQEEYNFLENQIEKEQEQTTSENDSNKKKETKNFLKKGNLFFKIIIVIELLFAICIFFYMSIFNSNVNILEYDISDYVSSTDYDFSRILTLITACSIIIGIIRRILVIPNNKSSYIKTILVLLILIPFACLLLKCLSFLFILSTDQLVELFEDIEFENVMLLIFLCFFGIGLLVLALYAIIFVFILFIFCVTVVGLYLIFNKLISIVANSKNIKGIFILIILAILVSSGIYILW